MTGAIVTVAVLALVCSVVAKVGYLALARDFPDFKIDPKYDFLMDAELALRFTQYRLTANLFRLQSHILLWLVCVLLIYNVLINL
jgi:hypothetical protein